MSKIDPDKLPKPMTPEGKRQQHKESRDQDMRVAKAAFKEKLLKELENRKAEYDEEIGDDDEGPLLYRLQELQEIIQLIKVLEP